MSLISPGTYDPASSCTGGPRPGAQALMSWYLGAYGAKGGGNGGIYNCRTVAGSSTRSVHSEGRACDLAVSPDRVGWGDTLAERLRGMSAELGIQGVIYNRRQWFSSQSANDYGWRSRSSDHDDHLHVELTRAAAGTLTAAFIEQTLNGTVPAPEPTEDDMLHTVIICDVNQGPEYGSTAVLDPVNGFTRTSSGLGPRDELTARVAIANALGFTVVEKHVDQNGWVMAQGRYTR